MQPVDITQPIYEPTYLNIEYVFDKIYGAIGPVWDFITNPKLWTIVGIISGLISIVCIMVIIFSLVRIREIQIEEKRKMDEEINQALLRDEERDRNANPRWHHILALVECSNESDWRMSIIEADTMMEEVLRERGLSGETTSELLESAKSSGYSSIQNAWDGHLVRNQIAHEGSEFPLSQVEARRVVKLFQNFFEDLGVI